MYIAWLTLNISLYYNYSDDTASDILCNATCDFLSSGKEKNNNGNCHNNSTTVSVDIPINPPTPLSVQYDLLNLGLYYHILASTAVTPVTSYDINDSTSLNATSTNCHHIPTKNPTTSELWGISSSVEEYASSQKIPITVGLTVGISTSILVLAILLIILIAILLIYTRRKVAREKQHSEHHDGSHSIQDPYDLSASENAYEQVHLQLSHESDTIGDISWQPQEDFDGIYSRVDNTEQLKSETQAAEINTHDDPTYDIIGQESNKEESKASHDGQQVSSKNQNLITHNDKASYSVDTQNESMLHISEEDLRVLYSVVNKKQKKDEDAPPVPSHTVEELYTAVAKPSKIKAADDEKEAVRSSYPTSMIEDHCTVVKEDSKDEAENEAVTPPTPLHRVEELYTAVQKEPKGMTVEDEEKAPPIPPHTVEELYTAVMKKPKVMIEDEEKAPPIPPYTVDDIVLSRTSDDDTK